MTGEGRTNEERPPGIQRRGASEPDGGGEELSVVPLDSFEADTAAAWDRFVQRDPRATFCHLSGWREVMGEVLGHDCHYRAALDGEGEWHGVLPLVRVRSRLFGDYLVSMPFLNYGGPLGSESARRALGEDAVRVAADLGVDLLELRGRHDLDVPGLTRNQRKVTVVLELPDDPEVLWEDGLRSKVRSQVRRPKKEGMTAEFGDDQLSAFYRVFQRNMRDLGTPVLPRSFFERIARVFGDTFELAVIYHEGTAVAAGAGFAWGEEFEITWASSLREYSRMAPNMLLYWSLMERMIEKRVGSFNFGRCTPGGGTHRFKSQWGGVDEPLPWSQWSSSEVDSTPDPEGRLFKIATSLWSRLPLGVANAVGPRLSRLIP